MFTEESRPGAAGNVYLGSNYAQPGTSRHAWPDGGLYPQWGWAGSRNTGQPLYRDGATMPPEFQSRVEAAVSGFKVDDPSRLAGSSRNVKGGGPLEDPAVASNVASVISGE